MAHPDNEFCIGSNHWTAAEWIDALSMSIVCDQKPEDRSLAVMMLADDIRSGRNEQGVPDRLRAEVADGLDLVRDSL